MVKFVLGLFVIIYTFKLFVQMNTDRSLTMWSSLYLGLLDRILVTALVFFLAMAFLSLLTKCYQRKKQNKSHTYTHTHKILRKNKKQN